MADQTVSIGIEVQLQDLMSQISKAEGLTEGAAQKMVIGLEKQIKKAEQAQKAATNAARTNAQAWKASEQQLGKSKEAISQVASAISTVSPELGGVISQAGAMGGAMKAAATAGGALGISMGALVAVAAPLAIALGALFVWYQKIQREEELATALMTTQKGAAASLEPALRGLETAKIDLAVATGDYSDEEARAIKLSMLARRAVLDLAKSQQGQRDEIQESINTNERWAKSWVSAIPGVDGIMGFSDKLETANAQMRTLGNTLVEQAEIQKELRKVMEETGRAQDRRSASSKGQAKAEKEAAESDRKRAEAIEEVRKAVEEQESAQKSLSDIQEQAYQALLGPMDELLRRQELEILNVQALGEASKDEALSAETMAKVKARQAMEIATLQASIDKDQQDRNQALADQAQADHDKAISDLTTYGSKAQSVMNSAFGGMADLGKWMAEETGKTSSKAAQRWFAFYQTAAATQIGIDAIVAGIKAVAELGPIAGGIAAAGIAASATIAIAQVGAEELPSYHRGGMVLAPDEIRMTRPEGVLTGTGVSAIGGPQGLEAANRGQSPVTKIMVVNQYRHKVFDRFIADNLELPNSTLGKALRGGSQVGHRAR